jgi:hypothetical protein
MSTLGKVLLVINLLAAAGVAYLASQAWAKQQEHNIALAKFGLVEAGFPLESGKTVNMSDPDAKVPFGLPTTGGRTADSVRVKVLQEYFAGAKGEYTAATPPSSVVDEVTEIKKNFEAKVSGAGGNPAQKLAFLIGTVGENGRLTPGPLMLLADDYEERQIFRSWLDTAAKDPAQADALFGYASSTMTRKFNEVTEKANDATANAHHQAILDAKAAKDKAFDDLGKAAIDQQNQMNVAYLQAVDALNKAVANPNSASTSDLERRRKAGALFICLDLSASAQKRAALVLGMKGYTAGVYDRVARLRSMPERYERAIESELAQFVLTYERRLNAAKDIDRLLVKQQTNRTALDESDAHLTKMVETRTTQRDTAKAQADALKLKVDAASAVQAGVEQEVFRLQKLVGALLVENFELEDKLLQAEKRKAGQ